MILTLDVGNSQLYGGVFKEEKQLIQFRKSTTSKSSSDELGIFLKSVLRENQLSFNEVSDIAICSVVPDIVYSLKGACLKYFQIDPFVLEAGVKTGLKIKYRNPLEVGSDRVANAIAVSRLYPKRNCIIVDLGTATTFCVLTHNQEYMGGVIMPGLRMSMESLEHKTARLPIVEIVHSKKSIGRSTVESIQSGLFLSHLGAIREIINCICQEHFREEDPYVIGTGGFAYLFNEEKVFNEIIPNLVLQGLIEALKINRSERI